MKYKNSFGIVGMLTLLFLTLSLASAASLSVSNTVIPSSVLSTAGSFAITFNLTNSGVDTNVSFIDSVLTSATGSISVPTTELLANQSKIITATVTFSAGQSGVIAGNIIADPSGLGSNQTIPFSVTITQPSITNFCKSGVKNASDLDLSVDVKNNGEGSDDEWLPFDDISVKVTLDNNKDVKVSNVVFEIGIFKSGATKNYASSMIWVSSDEVKTDIGTIQDGDSQDYTFEFKVDPKLTDGDYRLFVKAYKKSNEDSLCQDKSGDFSDADSYSLISLVREDSAGDRAVVVDVAALDQPITAGCGDQVILSPTIYNIGDNDQDQVLVTLYNKELGINIEKTIDNFNQGDDTTEDFAFAIPSTAAEKLYKLSFTTAYDYRSSSDTYRKTSRTFEAQLKVAGNCVVPMPVVPVISANLLSAAKIGEQLVVQVNIKNTGNKTENYVVGSENHDSWAQLVKVEPQIVNIAAGSSGTATITFTPTVAGQKSFNLKVIYSGQTATQPVSVTIAEKASVLSGFGSLGNTGLYVVSGIVLLLIIIVIVLIVKLASSGSKEEF
ncbi:MAG: putative S-layer protein [archaeon]